MRKIIFMMLFTIAGCGDGESGGKTEPQQSTNLSGQFNAGPLTSEAKFAEVKRKAESGILKDQVGLARRYYNGDGVPKDYAKAAEWYQKAAEQGSDFAQYNIGVMYNKGEGVSKDAAKAAEWWKKAAAQDNAAAQEALKNLPAHGS